MRGFVVAEHVEHPADEHRTCFTKYGADRRHFPKLDPKCSRPKWSPSSANLMGMEVSTPKLGQVSRTDT